VTSLVRVFCWCILAACVGACSQDRAGIDDGETRKMVELLIPQRVEIVEAFTDFESFDDDDIPDGIHLLIQASDAYGDSVKIAGELRVELYTHQRASGEPKGRRVCDPWFVRIADKSDQRRYWNEVTGMYEIPLEFPADFASDADAAGGSYVLAVTYNTPLDEHITEALADAKNLSPNVRTAARSGGI